MRADCQDQGGGGIFIKKNAQLPQVTRTLGLCFIPSKKFQNEDFLDGALVGVGSFKPTT